MTKSFLFLTLVLSLILAHTCSAGPTQLSTRGVDSDEDSDDSSKEEDTESDSEDEKDQNELNPAPSCLLFGDQVCHIECSILAQAYSIEAKGHCSENQTCQCDISESISFEDAWKKKFDTGYTYRKIAKDDMLLEQAHRIFNYPLRTGKQFKKLFKPILSPNQFAKLKINDQSLAAKFTKEDGSVDTAAVQKYVSEEVGKQLKSSTESLLKEKYQEKFKQALEKTSDSEGTLHNLMFRVRQINNKSLEDVLNAYLKKNSDKELKVEPIEDEGLNEIITNTITDEIIKQIDEKSKPPMKKKAAAKKPTTAPKRGGARFKASKT